MENALLGFPLALAARQPAAASTAEQAADSDENTNADGAPAIPVARNASETADKVPIDMASNGSNNKSYQPWALNSKIIWKGCTAEQFANDKRCRGHEFKKPNLPVNGDPSPIWSYGACLLGARDKSKNWICLHQVPIGKAEDGSLKYGPCGVPLDYPEPSNIWNGHFKSKHKATYEEGEKTKAERQAMSGAGGSSKRGGDGGWYGRANAKAMLTMQVWAVVW